MHAVSAVTGFAETLEERSLVHKKERSASLLRTNGFTSANVSYFVSKIVLFFFYFKLANIYVITEITEIIQIDQQIRALILRLIFPSIL